MATYLPLLYTVPMNEFNRSLLEELGGVPETPIEIAVEGAPDRTPVTGAPAFVQATPSTGTSGLTTSNEERALSLLGSGLHAEAVAAALGVTPARISQLLAEKVFAARVADLRFANLQKHNKRDDAYDSLEDKLLAKLERSMPLLVRPESILKAVSIVNGAKRRGQSAPTQVNNQQNIVTLILPTVIAQKFSVDTNNQVTRAGQQDLLTMPSGNLLKQVEAAEELRLEEIGHVCEEK